MKVLKLFWRAFNGHVLIVAFLIGLFAMVMVCTQQLLGHAENSVKGSLSMVVFLQSAVAESDAMSLSALMKNQDSDILAIDYTSKEQAYQEAVKDSNLAKSLLLLKSNPLPASLTIQYADRAWFERMDPAVRWRSLPAIQEIRWDPQAQTLFRSLHRWRLWSVRFTMFIGLILATWAFMGLYRFLALQSEFRDIAVHLGIGVFGGALAWSLWGIGLHSIQAEISVLRPTWVWLIPLVFGLVAAVGCYGLDLRPIDRELPHAE